MISRQFFLASMMALPGIEKSKIPKLLFNLNNLN